MIKGARHVRQSQNETDSVSSRIYLKFLADADESCVVVIRNLNVVFENVQTIKIRAFT